MDQVVSRVKRAHGATICAMDDCFVVKYSARDGESGQLELPRHTDAGELSFMVALSDQATDYVGGGTQFDALDGNVLQLPQGDIVTFDAKLFHRGMPITRGVRYLLVGFCWADATASLEPGNLSLEFQIIIPPRRGGVVIPKREIADRGAQRVAVAASWSNAVDFHGSSAAGIRYDARILFAATEGASCWLSHARIQSGEFSCALEAFVASIFSFHLTACGGDRGRGSPAGGAEFWVQLCSEDEGIPFHFDKDEKAARGAGRPWRHPKVATVTYLTDGGAPTVVFESCRGGPRKAAADGRAAAGPAQAFVSYPRAWKHLVFSGKLLHGVPQELNFAPPYTRPSEPGTRMTLLVNVWPRAAPKGIGPLPPALAARLSQAGAPQLNIGRRSGGEGDSPAVVDAALLPPSSLVPLEEHQEGMTAPLPVRELWALGAWRRERTDGAAIVLKATGTGTEEKRACCPVVSAKSSCLVLLEGPS